MSSVYQVSTAEVSAPRVRVPQAATGRKVERRAVRRRGRRFEDQAAAIVQHHAARSRNHRHSVLLFYLLFGLLAGFFLGIAGAKGVLASTMEPTISSFDLASATKTAAMFDIDHGPFGTAVPSHVQQQQRYASLLPLGASQFDLVFVERQTGTVLSDDTIMANKQLFMAILALIFAVAVSLAGTFWHHLGKAHARARRTRLDWGSDNR